MALLDIVMDEELEPATLARVHWYMPADPAPTTNAMV